MSGTWPSTALGEVLRRSERIATLDPEKMYKEVTVRMNGKGVVERRLVKGIEILPGRRYQAQQGQFIMSRIDARHGASGLVPLELDGALVTNDFPLFDVVASRLNPTFLGWLSKTSPFVELCKQASEGTTNRVRLSEDRFQALKIALPSIEEQQRIVARIGDLVSRLSVAKSLREEARKETDAIIGSIHFASSSTAPESLDNFLELHEESISIEIGKPYPQAGVRGFGGGLFAKPAVVGGDTTYRAFNRLYPNALVMSQVKGWEGAVAVTPDHLVGVFVSPEYRTFRCKTNRCLPAYLAAIVSTEFFWGSLKFATRGVGARRERTRPEQFLQLKFSMPSIERQRQAVETFSAVHSVRRLQNETGVELEAMLPAILDKAFKNEL